MTDPDRFVAVYAGVVYGVLFAAGLLLAWLRWGMAADVGHAWRAYRGWLYIVPAITLAILLGRGATIVFFTAVAVFGFREFARATALDADGPITAVAYLAVAAPGLVQLPGRDGGYDVFMTLPVFVTAGLLLVPVLRNRSAGQLRPVTLAVVGSLYFGWMGGHVALLAGTDRAAADLLYLLFAVAVNDIAAFVGGRLFGRHALRDNISPRKTWEGAATALVVSLVLPWALWPVLPSRAPIDLVAAGLIVGVGGQVGDLVVSFIKRDLRLKDMGAAIPGHGGVLDRIDSLVYVGPLFFHYLRFRHVIG